MRLTQKKKLFYNTKPSAYYFYVKRIISVDFQICFSVPLTFSVAFGIYFENIKGILKTVRVMSYVTAINFCRVTLEL